MITISENRITVRLHNSVSVYEPYGPGCIRCRSTRNSVISDEKWTLLDALPAQYTITLEENTATLVNGDLTLKIADGNPWNNARVTYLRKGKEILRSRQEGDPMGNFSHTEGDHYRSTVIFESNEGEHLYGLGQEQQDWFDRKGGAYDLLHYNTKSTLPYLYSSLGYGFLWNNPAPGRCEATKNHTLWCADSTYQVDYLVFVGNTPADVAKTYCDLTGYAPAMPEWAAGFWQCKLRYEDQEELLSVAREYVRHGIPVSAIVIDYFHWTEQGEWKFDPKYWPDPEGMCRELKELGIQPIVSIWPTINPNSENFRHMNDAGMLVRTETGQYGTFSFYGQQTFFDSTNPETQKYVWDIVKHNYYDKGIHNFWLDEAEPEVHPQQFWHLHFYKGNGAQTAMLYPYYYSKMFYEGLKNAGEDKIILLTRAAYPGSQRFGSAVWNGDIPSTWQALRQSVVSGLSMAVCGIPWWNSDIGGFLFADTQSDDFRELIVRWFQFGLFSPIMRLHGSRQRIPGTPVRNPGIIEPTGGPNEIWRFGDRAYPIIEKLIHLRNKLRPYILALTEEASQKGLPLMRPMFYQYPDDEKCYQLSDQYMFGGSILFAPIMERGQTSRDVYLPGGRWVLTKDGSVYEGGQTVSVHAELEDFIAFVPEGDDVLDVFRA
ncbi:MAG: hypothetical protein E7331_12485 [Clostridiales bacterium]|nr:hypothetical protein [Clostridiales bacterium]